MNVAGQPADTLVPTPRGFRRLGEVSVGEELFGADGQPTTVLAASDIGIAPVLRLHFDDGAQAVVTPEHLWQTRDTAAHATAVYRTADMVAHLRRPDGAWRWTVPAPEEIEFPWSASLPVDPYTFGRQLREGVVDAGTELEQYLTAGGEDRRDMLDGLLGDMVSIPATGAPIALAAAASLIRSLGGLTFWVRRGGGYTLDPLWIDGGGLRRELVAAGDAGSAPCRAISVACGLYVTGADFVLTHGALPAAQLGAAA